MNTTITTASRASTAFAGEPIAVDIRPESVATSSFPQHFGPITGEHVDVINAEAWHQLGIDGTGVTIGVIDFFDVPKFWNSAEHGPTPVAGVTARCFNAGADCTNKFFDGVDEGGEDHGVAVVEAILDVAPNARILLGQALTISDYRDLVDWFVANDVDIISRSLGSRFDGPGDGRGALNDVVANAVDRGILWVNSAGNNGKNKYYRHQVRLVGDRVAFGPSGDSTFLRFTGCTALGGIRWANDWDTPARDRTDYDAYLWESPTGDPAAGSVIASSRLKQRLGAPPLENIGADHCPAIGSSLYLELRWLGGDISGDVLEILDYGAGMALYTSNASSAAVSVVDSAVPGVVAVGAIDPVASGQVASYSSRGPTNDGRIVPAVVAPSNFRSSIQGRFAGTSASAAVVAGAAALLYDADLAADPTSLGDLIRHLTIDRGVPGPDNDYGYGEFRLPSPPPAAGVDQTPSRFVALDIPARFLDTRVETAIGPPDLIGEVQRGQILDLPVVGVGGVPASGVTAIAINIVSTHPDRPSYVQAFPTERAAVGGYSNLNIDAPGQSRANFAVVPIGADGKISLYSIADGHIVVDVLGWFEASPGATSAGRFVELGVAQRLLDTRTDPPIGPLLSSELRSVPLPTGVDAAHVAALVVTVTAAFPTAPGWLQAYPTDRPDVIAKTSTVNTASGASVANTAIVPIGGSGISVTGFFAEGGHAHVVVDAIGYITSEAATASTAGRYVSVRPARAFDSRSTGGQLADGQTVVINGSSAPGVTIPSSATAVVWNAAIVSATRPGFMRAWGADDVEPATSALNWSAVGEVRAGALVTAVDFGRARFKIEDGEQNLPGPVGHLIADVFGYFT